MIARSSLNSPRIDSKGLSMSILAFHYTITIITTTPIRRFKLFSSTINDQQPARGCDENLPVSPPILILPRPSSADDRFDLIIICLIGGLMCSIRSFKRTFNDCGNWTREISDHAESRKYHELIGLDLTFHHSFRLQ